MPLIIPLRGKTPIVGENCWIAPNATLIGDVQIGENSSIWFNTVIRGDVHSIRIGRRVNIQDLVMVHCTYNKAATSIGDDVTIGHSAIIHGCSIGDRVLVGMGAIIMDGCVVHSDAIVAAGSVLTEGTVVESGAIFAGVPAKKVKQSDPAVLREEILRTAANYQMYSSWYRVDP